MWLHVGIFTQWLFNDSSEILDKFDEYGARLTCGEDGKVLEIWLEWLSRRFIELLIVLGNSRTSASGSAWTTWRPSPRLRPSDFWTKMCSRISSRRLRWTTLSEAEMICFAFTKITKNSWPRKIITLSFILFFYITFIALSKNTFFFYSESFRALLPGWPNSTKRLLDALRMNCDLLL